MDGELQLRGTCFELPVLSRLLLQVQIDVAVVVALLLVVDGGVDEAQILTDRGYEVGSLLHFLVVFERVVEADERRAVVADMPETFAKRPPASCRLIHVAVSLEEVERALGQVARNQ